MEKAGELRNTLLQQVGKVRFSVYLIFQIKRSTNIKFYVNFRDTYDLSDHHFLYICGPFVSCLRMHF